MKIYTKGGDKGFTSLIGGERARKDDLRVEAYGSVDELSAHIAMLQDMLREKAIDFPIDNLTAIMTDLMDVEALFALGKGGEEKVKDLERKRIEWIEERIDKMNGDLKPLNRFTIGAGATPIAQAQICRTVCRRAERRALEAAESYEISHNALVYLNRLSDYLYIAARTLSQTMGIEEQTWH